MARRRSLAVVTAISNPIVTVGDGLVFAGLSCGGLIARPGIATE
jgi:hypothetical protein